MSQHPLGIRPARMVIDGTAWVPEAWANELAERLRQKQRSLKSHNHQFAEIADLWASLPDDLANMPYAKSAEAFRKHGLIETGHCDVETHVFDCVDDLARIGPVMKRGADAEHGYSVVARKGNVLVIYRPHSQSYKAMGRDRFRQSKQDVLDWGYRLLGVTA